MLLNGGVQPQLYADNLKCVSGDPGLLSHAARFTTGYVRLVGQELAPSKCVLSSTSREVWKDMKDWYSLLKGTSGLSSLMSGIWEVIWILHFVVALRLLLLEFVFVFSRLVLIFALPLDFHGRVRVVRSMYLPAALHGIEASLLASDSLRKLRSSICSVVWSRRQLMANVGAVLGLLDGATGCDTSFCVVWFRFRLLGRCLAPWPAEVGRVYRLLEMVGDGCPGHGPVHLLPASAAEIGFRWNPDALVRVGPGLPMLTDLAGPIQHFRSAIMVLGVTRFLLTFADGKAFEVVLCSMSVAPCSSLILLMFEKEISVCFVASWLGVSGMVSF